MVGQGVFSFFSAVFWPCKSKVAIDISDTGANCTCDLKELYEA